MLAAISASICATASCRPTGLPHCTRLAAKSRATFRHHLPAAAQLIGTVSRPVLSVTSASLSPRPSPHSRFSRGTRTWVNRSRAFSMPRSPMNSSRLTISIPGHEVSTMKALIGPGLPSLPGVRAITTISSAIGPFVHHSFSPLSR